MDQYLSKKEEWYQVIVMKHSSAVECRIYPLAKS